MKLSEAMREGAKHCPQAFGDYVRGESRCAISTAYWYAMNGEDILEDDDGATILTAFQEAFSHIDFNVFGVHHQYPDDDLYTTVLHLNDEKCYSREEIADWLEVNGY